MNDQYAKPGDTIQITWDAEGWLGKRVLVVERPADGNGGNNPGDAWFLHEPDGSLLYFAFTAYVVVERANPLTTQSKDVDESLKRQLNDNLRRAFGY